MKWQPQHATGDAEIDAQHKMLFDASDQFRETLEAGEGRKTYDLFLGFLNHYTELHFSIEEECMMAHRCPVAAHNKNEHGLFLKRVKKEIDRFAMEGFSRESATAMLDMLDRWLDSHICRIDVKLMDVIGQR